VRDAIKVLSEKGLVEVRPGAGTFVVQRVSDMVARSMGLLLQIEDSPFESLQEVRLVLEAEVAGLAAERATGSDIDRMKRALVEMMHINDRPFPHSMDDFIGFAEADMEFHVAIAEATSNGVFSVLLGAMADLTEKVRRMVMVVPDAPIRIIEHHRHILDSIQQKSKDQACEAMKQHVHQITQDLKTALAQSNLLEGLDLD
jgi:GntR family transcriptional repressor for pyruvate dehydrogenase complex